MAVAPTPTRFLRAALRLASAASAALLALALVGHVLRDRTSWLAILMYLPMVLLAPLVILVQLAAYERRRWRWHAGVIAVAAAAGVIAAVSMRGSGSRASPQGSMRIVQWNVQWGRDDAGWLRTVEQIEQAMPDLVILSEAPPDEKLASLSARLGPEWSFKVSRNVPGSRYWYGIAIVTRGPIDNVNELPLPNGAALAADVTVQSFGPIRVLAVDGVSNPRLSRGPLLAAVVRHAAAEDVDVVAGDFNAVSRSIGFDGLRGRGFELASLACEGWRGTFPSTLPLYDIDHIWLGGSLSPSGCVMLRSPGTNHRGQLACVSVGS